MDIQLSKEITRLEWNWEVPYCSIQAADGPRPESDKFSPQIHAHNRNDY
jgi:hypothetical protein